MNTKLLNHFRNACNQAFVPIFVHDNFDTEILLKGCKLAGVKVVEYTLRREDAHLVIPTLRERLPEVSIFVGSTLDDEAITLQMKKKNPQLMTVKELAPFVDGFVSMLPYTNETLEAYRESHLLIPTAETGGEALRQMSHGATVIKVCGPDFSFSKSLHAAPTFNYCPTFITGGVTPERMEEAYVCGNMLTAAGFDLILKGEDPQALTAKRVAERLGHFLSTAKKARAKVSPFWAKAEDLSDEAFVEKFPHYISFI
ncbi:MAG: hypothetical protein IKJ74_04955 [Clostridia bacterium]|nr:hypothetical protein [Clostridia bacterium]